MRHQVLVEELRKASDTTVSVVEQAGEAQLGAVGEKISRALPGTTAAQAAASTGRSWARTTATTALRCGSLLVMTHLG